MSAESPAENTKATEILIEFSGPMKMLAVLVICAFGVALVCSLSVTDIWSSHEGRVVDVARNTLASGEFWVPMLNGVPRLEKSPLVYWIVAASGKMWGELNEFSARLPSLIVGLAGVLVTILIGRRMFNSTVGLIAGLVQISTFVYWRECRTAELDLYLTFFISLGMLAFCRLLFNNSRKNRWGWVLLFWVSMGAAAASKSILTVPPALVACGLGLLVCRSKNNGDKQTAGLWWWHVIGITLFLAIGAAWNVGMLLKFPELSQGLWNREITHILLHADSSRPMYFYLSRIFVWAFPASAFVPAALLVIFSPRLKQYRKQILFLLLWVVVVVGAFSIWPSGKKKVEYILPMISAFALLAGLAWSELLSKHTQAKFNLGDRITLTAHSLLLLVCGVVAVGFSLVDAESRWGVAVVGAGLITLSIVSVIIKTKRVQILLWGTALGALAAMIVNFVWIQPVMNQQISPRIFAEAAEKHGAKEGNVAIYSRGFRRESPAKRKEQGIPPLNFYLKYNLNYLYGVTELERFLKYRPNGLIITWTNSLTEAELKKLGLKVLHRQDIHKPHLALTTKRLPQSWREPIGDILVKYAQKPMKYTLLVGKDHCH
ncbi:MAG: phospholipid carrier-dependent glycosyltransferase [Actinobacteria bacterium]|nr:phospholipid carrier-dependent glycosyltransferase [Actinomycetota bacterium]